MNVGNFATRDVISVGSNDAIDTALGLMEDRGIHHVVIVDGGGVAGMVSDRDMLLATGWMSNSEREVRAPNGDAEVVGPTRIGEIMSHPALVVNEGDSAQRAAALLLEYRIGALPVVNDGALVGILTNADLLRWVLTLGDGSPNIARFLQSPIDARMRREVLTVAADASFDDVYELLKHSDARHVLVCAENGELEGIISDRDMLRALGWSDVREMQADAQGRLIETPGAARDIMHPGVIAVRGRASTGEAIRLLLEHHIHAAPVVGDEGLLGLFVQRDVIAAIRDEALL